MTVEPVLEFKVGDHKYQSTRMGVFDLNTVASRLGGILLLMFDNMKKTKEMPGTEFARAFTLLSGDMRKEDVDQAITLCLTNVARLVEGDIGWAPVLTQAPGILAFQDIELSEMLEIVWNVIKQHRLPDFFSAPLSKSKEKRGAAKSN